MAVEWDESCSVGIDTFDSHHKKLFELLNTLTKISDIGEAGSETAGKTLKELLDYTEYHFSEEEKALGECGHPDFQVQKEEHEYFANKIKGYCTYYLSGTEPLASDVVEFLYWWLLYHIKEKDRNYTTLLRSKGIN